jgi:hypothetical protein
MPIMTCTRWEVIYATWEGHLRRALCSGLRDGHPQHSTWLDFGFYMQFEAAAAVKPCVSAEGACPSPCVLRRAPRIPAQL